MYINNTFKISLLIFTSSLANANVSGTVFQDLPFNGNITNTYGQKDPNELGIKDINVTAYPGGISTTTDDNGLWSLNTSGKVRIEFSNIPSYLKESENSSSVQFIEDGEVSTFALYNPADYSTENRSLITTHFVNGKSALNTALPTLFSWPYTNQGFVNSNQQTLSTTDNLRSIWGLAYSPSRKTLYSATFLRRHTSIGNNGLGQIYITNLETNNTTDFISIPNAGTIDETIRGLNEANQPNTDSTSFSKVAKIGLGDISLSEDETTLYVMNLNDKKIYEVNLENNTTTSYPSPTPNCTNGENRPFALTQHNGALYVGSVCDASTAACDTSIANNCSALTAHVFKIPQGTTNGTEVLSIRLDYEKEYAADDAGLYEGTHRFWNAWTDDYTKLVANTDRVIFPVPVLSNIKFDENENLLLAFADRTAMQGGASTNDISGALNERFTYSGGDILKASYQIDGNYTLNNINFLDDNTSRSYHKEGALGAISYTMGSNEITFTQYDNYGTESNSVNTKGVTFLNNTTGLKIRSYRLADDNRPTYFGKSMGIGDLEMITDAAPTEIGNYLWADENGNCVQDANESGIDNVIISLLHNNIVIATQTTSNGGYYLFKNITPNQDYTLRIDTNQSTLSDRELTTCNNNGEGANPLLNNSDARLNGSTAEVSISNLDIKSTGSNNHSFDIGFKPIQNSITTTNIYSLGDRVWMDSNRDGIQDSTEIGLNGVTVNLYNSADCSGDILKTTTTSNGGSPAKDGFYLFTDLNSSVYCIEFQDILNDYNITSINQGADDSTDSDANEYAKIVNINLVADTLQEDIGIYPKNITEDISHTDGTCSCHPYETSSVTTLNRVTIIILILLTSLTALFFQRKE